MGKRPVLSSRQADASVRVKLVDASADLIHVDVVDAHFMLALTIGSPIEHDAAAIPEGGA